MLLVAALCSAPVLADDNSWKELTTNGWLTTTTQWEQDDPQSAHISRMRGLDFATQYTISATIAHSESGKQKLYFNFFSLNSEYMCKPSTEASTIVAQVNGSTVRFKHWCIHDATYKDFYFSSMTAKSAKEAKFVLNALRHAPATVNFKNDRFELDFPAIGFAQAWQASKGNTNAWNPSVQDVL